MLRAPFSQFIADIYERTQSVEATARRCRTDTGTVLAAVRARKTIRALQPLLADAEREAAAIDAMRPTREAARRAQGQRLREERLRCGLTMPQAAAALGCGKRLYRQVEHGKRDCYRLDFHRRMPAFAIDGSYVMFGTRRSGPK